MTPRPHCHVLLLVEDRPGGGDLVRSMLETARRSYEIQLAVRIADAAVILENGNVDVILLDLDLADRQGIQTVEEARRVAGNIPIVVLTGEDNDEQAMACLDAGAQDYLSKSELAGRNLERSIGYAVGRVREAQLREQRATLERYRALSSAEQTTTVTASMIGSGAISERYPERFESVTRHYHELLEAYLRQGATWSESARAMRESIVTELGDVAGGPRDLLDVHVAALNRACAEQDQRRAAEKVFESRLLALEMMGLLVDYYRVGQRRLVSGQGGAP